MTSVTCPLASTIYQQTVPLPPWLSPPYTLSEDKGTSTYALFTASDLQVRAPDFHFPHVYEISPAVFVFVPAYTQSVVIWYSHSIFASCLNVASYCAGLLKFFGAASALLQILWAFSRRQYPRRCMSAINGNFRIPVERIHGFYLFSLSYSSHITSALLPSIQGRRQDSRYLISQFRMNRILIPSERWFTLYGYPCCSVLSIHVESSHYGGSRPLRCSRGIHHRTKLLPIQPNTIFSFVYQRIVMK